MDLDNREIAATIWLALVLLLCCLKSDIRQCLFGVIKAFFHPKILKVVGLVYTHLFLLIVLLDRIGLWSDDQTKNALIWSVAVGIGSLLKMNSISKNPHFFRDWVADNIKIIVVVEYLVTHYTFSLWIELILLPISVLVFGMIAVAGTEAKHQAAVKFLNGLVNAIGLLMVSYAAYSIFEDFDAFASAETLRDFYTPIILSLLFLPFIFILHVYSVYETTFIAFSTLIEDEKLRRRAKFCVAVRFRANLDGLNRWKRHIGIHRLTNGSDIQSSIAEIKRTLRRERHPLPVAPEQGWEPRAARGFLKEYAFRISDYHRSHDEWYASSDYLKIGSGLFYNTLVYSIEGGELSATRLKLRLVVMETDHASQADQQFKQICNSLLLNAIFPHQVDLNRDELNERTGLYVVTLNREPWIGKEGRYERTLTISLVDAQARHPIGI